MLSRWQALQAQFAQTPARTRPCRTSRTTALVLDDWLGGLRDARPAMAAATPARLWLELVPGRLCADPKKRTSRAPTACSSPGCACWRPAPAAWRWPGVIVGRDACVTVRPWPAGARRGRAGRADAGLARRPVRQRARRCRWRRARRWRWCRACADVAARLRRQRLRPRPARRRRRGLPGAPASRTTRRCVADGRFEALAQRLFGPAGGVGRDDVQARDLHADDEAVPTRRQRA